MSGGADVIGEAAREHLKSFVQRIERLEEEKANIGADLKEVYAEAKSMGFDTKVLRKVISLRKMDRNDRAEMEAMLDLYLGAIGDEAPLLASAGIVAPRLLPGAIASETAARLVAAVSGQPETMFTDDHREAARKIAALLDGAGASRSSPAAA